MVYGFIGLGNMAGAILRGMAGSGIRHALRLQSLARKNAKLGA